MPDLAELRRLEQKATPVPWKNKLALGAGFSAVYEEIGRIADLFIGRRGDVDRYDRPGTALDDASLIAAMRNALPALLDVAQTAHALIYDGGTARALSEALDRLEDADGQG